MPFNIVFFFRKARDSGNYSIESYFNEIIKYFPANINSSIKIARFRSNGFWKRVYISLEVIFMQGDINHVTGDVHFLTLFLRKKKTILTIHDCGFMHHPSPVARFIFKWFWLKLPVSRAVIVTAVSQATKNDIVLYTRCNPEKIRVINTSVSVDFTVSLKEFNKQKPVILQIGTAENKNLERLIPALEGLSCLLNIIGKLSESQLSLLRKYNIDYINSFNVSNEEILTAYKNCDIVALASTLEGFGMPIIEANRIGRVVITGNTSAMAEVAGNAACLVDPANVDSIKAGFLKVIKEDEYRMQLIQNGIINKTRFLPEKISEQYYFLYMELLNLNQTENN